MILGAQRSDRAAGFNRVLVQKSRLYGEGVGCCPLFGADAGGCCGNYRRRRRTWAETRRWPRNWDPRGAGTLRRWPLPTPTPPTPSSKRATPPEVLACTLHSSESFLIFFLVISLVAFEGGLSSGVACRVRQGSESLGSGDLMQLPDGAWCRTLLYTRDEFPIA